MRADHASAGLPHDPPADADGHAQAAGGDDAEVAAAAQAGGVSLDELAKGGFQLLIPDAQADAKSVKRVVACSGKVYYDLLEEAQKRGLKDVAILRVEQLYPFPRRELTAELKKYAKATDLVWCQEEPQNQGAWYQIQHHLNACLQPKQSVHYAGRPRSPSPAVGHFSRPRRRTAAAGRRRAGEPVERPHFARITPHSAEKPHGHRYQSPGPPRVRFRRHHRELAQEAGRCGQARREPVDLETDKVVLEVPSPADGVLKEIKFAEGATVTSQQVIAVIEEGAVAAAAPVGGLQPRRLRPGCCRG